MRFATPVYVWQVQLVLISGKETERLFLNKPRYRWDAYGATTITYDTWETLFSFRKPSRIALAKPTGLLPYLPKPHRF